MANQARITSTEALESFRASLIVFLTKARRALADTDDEVRGTRSWLQHDRRIHWENEIRRHTKALDRAQAELVSAHLAQNNESARMVRQAAVNKAKRELDEAQNKLRVVKKWNQNYESRVDPLIKRMESLAQFLEHDMPKAIAYLAQVQDTLDAYIQTPAAETGGGQSTGLPAKTEVVS